MILTPAKIIGSGRESVYLYYYDNDRRLAKHEGRDRWECKIGKGSSRAATRVRSQVKTAEARKPVLAVEVRTDSSYSLESMIHDRLRDLKIDGHAGDEWFMTNPDEFEATCRQTLSELGTIMDVTDIDSESIVCSIEDSSDWGAALSIVRSNAGLSQTDLSLYAGIRQGTISNIERGRPVKLNTVWRLFRALGYSAILIKPGSNNVAKTTPN